MSFTHDIFLGKVLITDRLTDA